MKSSKEMSPLPRVLSGLGYVGLLGACFGLGTLGGWIHQSPLAERILIDRIENVPVQQEFDGKDHLVVLLLGCDEDLAPGGKKLLKASARADMLLLADLDFANKQISGLAIPRDLRVKMPGEPLHKMNAFYHSAAPGHEEEDQKRAVEFMLPEVHIDKVISLSFPAFEELVNEVEGVTVNVDKKMDYDDKAGNVHAHFIPGVAHLDGYQAEMYVRFRHQDNDMERHKRQQQFLIAFKDSLMRHKSKLMQVAETGKKVFGNALSDRQIAALANFIGTVQQKDIKLGELPAHPGPGTWMLIDNKPKVKQALREYRLTGFPNPPVNN